MSRRHGNAKSTEKFLAEAHQKHGDRFDYHLAKYETAKTNIRIRCPDHGYFEQTPETHLKGTGCPRCGDKAAGAKRKIPWGEVLRRFRKVHDDRYDYADVCYINQSTKITIRCRLHGQFRQLPHVHAKGQGCPKCRYDRSSAAQRLSLIEILKRFHSAHGDRYDYHLVTQQRCVNCKVDIICKKHGIFRQAIHKHAWGQGCARCCSSKGERYIASVLDAMGADYIPQKRFESCFDVRPLSFDFFVPADRTLIEYDGLQHFKRSHRRDFDTIQKHDAIKTAWAKQRDYMLIRIPYYRFDSIPQILNQSISGTPVCRQLSFQW